MKTPALSVNQIKKHFGHKQVLKNVSFDVHPGQVMTLVGPNGAGKTTLFRIISGLMSPDEGSVSLFGQDPFQRPEQALKHVMFLSDDPEIFSYLTSREFLHYHSALRGLNQKDVNLRLPKLMGIFPNLPDLDEPLGQQSRGSRQKILFLAAWLAEVRLIVTDEPIVGLDPVSIEALSAQLQQFADDGGAVLMALHTLDFAEEVATDIIGLNNGLLIGPEPAKRKNIEKWYSDHVQS